MADTSLITAVGAAALTIAQTISGVLRVGDLRRRVTKLARAVEQELPAEIAALAKRLDDHLRVARRQATASQPGTNMAGELQGLRDRVTAAEAKVIELSRRLDEQREAFAAHREASDDAWHELDKQIHGIIAGLNGIDALGTGARSGRRG